MCLALSGWLIDETELQWGFLPELFNFLCRLAEIGEEEEATKLSGDRDVPVAQTFVTWWAIIGSFVSGYEGTDLCKKWTVYIRA